ncbi:MAG: NAD(P)/FAD-dependent oxidoreductase [Oscillospiraceae bacterium]|nr:NAD(P)/FAD-dependent oxidoreductase [Oscillospiraceae bacterium]
MAAAVGAKEAGADDILILERDGTLGGILCQCIHNGFGLHIFGEELTGPEYAQRYIDKITQFDIPYKLSTMVLDISPDKIITAVNPIDGMMQIQAGAVILAMGCRERPRGAINIEGTRCAGIYTAGTAQKYVNIHGYMPGREVVVLGSGDIGLIMARRMTLEGAKVKAVVELMPYSGGLVRNIVQCLDDFGIPLKFSHTVTEIKGKARVESVTIVRVDENFRPIPGTEEEIACDTLLLSVGLIPENELSQAAGVELSPVTGGPIVGESFNTGVDGIFACGNALHVHDLVDYVSEESVGAGKNAAAYVRGEKFGNGEVKIIPGKGVRYTVPSAIDPGRVDKLCVVRFRVDNVYRGASVCVYFDGERVSGTKKRIAAPGEMETLRLPKSRFTERPGCKEITITLEEGDPA